MIHRTPFFLPLLYPALTWRMPEDKCVYLTFDDGPVPGPTEFVIETLADAGIPATFFCIGDNIRKHPEIYREILAHGHAVGNHTFHHLNGWDTGTRRYVDDVVACSEMMSSSGNRPGRALFRPPYGRISRSQISALHDFRIVMWDVLSMDYRKTLSPERCLHNTIRAIRNGSIVVFHDSLKAEKNLRFVLPRFIEHVRSAGFTFNVIPS